MKIEIGASTLHHGDSRDVLAEMPDASVDSVVCDPPYALVSAAPAKGNDAYARASAGFMGKSWDTGEVAFAVEFWEQVMRVLKPGGHVVAFAGTRTYHRLAVAIEDSGFEIRDQLAWVYGSGFPKSHNVSKGIDKLLGAEREVTGTTKGAASSDTNSLGEFKSEYDVTAPATPEAQQWEGWGTALKPAWEPIVLARKPLIGTVAANVLEHGTGAINIDGCRIPAEDSQLAEKYASVQNAPPRDNSIYGTDDRSRAGSAPHDAGRFPANILHDGDQFGEQGRYFYSPKASKKDRGEGNTHPTLKPTPLMEYLVRMVTPPGGVVLDPFMGSGSTGKACMNEGFRFVGIEREDEYYEIAVTRLYNHLLDISE